MSEERSTDKLARYILWAATAAIIVALCWYFRNVLIYIIIAAVVSLLGRPIMRLLRKIGIKGHRLPDWLLAIITLILILGIFLGIITQVIPVVSGIIQSVSSNLQSASFIWLIDRIPSLGRDFKIQEALTAWLTKTFDLSSITSVVGSVASALGSFAIGLFSVMFISFFFIKDGKLFRRIIGSIVPDKHEKEAISAVGDIVSALTLIAIFAFTQMVDNFLFQPLIYSKSIKSSPLEIFIVLLMAGHVGGIVGMLVAIPAYTVIRVIAARFFTGFKPIRRLVASTDNDNGTD